MTHGSLNVRQKLRASHITRWHIVEVGRRQSVAEHSFNVMLLCEEMSDLIGATDEFRQQCRECALFHDIAEIVLGDTPTPVKSVLGAEAAARVADVEASISPRVFHTFTIDMVKLADILEAVLFLAAQGVGTHARLVREELVASVWISAEKLPIDTQDKLYEFILSVLVWDTEDDDGEGVTWYK